MKKKTKRINQSYFVIFVAALAVLLSVFAVMQTRDGGFTAEPETTVTTTEPTTEEITEPYIISTAVIRSAGDILIHNPIHRAAKKADGSYDFSNIFTNLKRLQRVAITLS